ncbi:MAG: globin domain-containing protein [Phycisphaerales bacterium]
MTPQQIALIRQSFNDLHNPEALINEFYARLFAKAPQVRDLFPKDMTAQRKHLASALALVVNKADALHTLEKPLAEMGARHVGYGAKPEHYPVVRDVMVETIMHTLGPKGSTQIRDAWTVALDAVASAMIKGASQNRVAA